MILVSLILHAGHMDSAELLALTTNVSVRQDGVEVTVNDQPRPVRVLPSGSTLRLSALTAAAAPTRQMTAPITVSAFNPDAN